MKSFSRCPSTTGGVVLAVSPARHLSQPPPGWQQKLDRALAIWHRSSADVTHRGQVKAAVAHRLLQTLLAQRP